MLALGYEVLRRAFGMVFTGVNIPLSTFLFKLGGHMAAAAAAELGQTDRQYPPLSKSIPRPRYELLSCCAMQ